MVKVAGRVRADGRETDAIRVLVAEDMRILRDTLVAVLNLESDIEVVAQVADGEAIVPNAVSAQPDVAVVDIDLPGTDGLTAAAELHERCPHCAVLILTVLGNPGSLRRALAAHVAGFLPKDIPADELIRAVRTVAGGRRVFDQELILSALDGPMMPWMLWGMGLTFGIGQLVSGLVLYWNLER